MLLDLREVKGSEAVVKRTHPAEAISSESGDEYSLISDVILELRISRDKERVYIAGQLQSELSLPCCRCLEPFKVKISRDVDLLYLPQSVNNGDSEKEITVNDLAVSFYSEEKIDLKQMIREQFELELPMKPLCREDCKGLCQACGINLNFKICRCDANWRDPRLETLKVFRSDKQ